MPYIPQDKRDNVDASIDEIVRYVKSLPVEKQDGVLNYTMTRMLKQIYSENYFHLNRAVGVVESVKDEYIRRVVVPYEDNKIEQNGDVV